MTFPCRFSCFFIQLAKRLEYFLVFPGKCTQNFPMFCKFHPEFLHVQFFTKPNDFSSLFSTKKAGKFRTSACIRGIFPRSSHQNSCRPAEKKTPLRQCLQKRRRYSQKRADSLPYGYGFHPVSDDNHRYFAFCSGRRSIRIRSTSPCRIPSAAAAPDTLPAPSGTHGYHGRQ